MKLAIVGDVHWCSTSSILRSRGNTYTHRLENLIKTVNWCEDVAERKGVASVIYLGDFFDRADLNSEEISALNDITWTDIDHVMLVGNHEIGRSDNTFNSVNVFKSKNFTIMDKPQKFTIDDRTVGFLPYILESDRDTIENTLGYCDIIFSHNDIQTQYGQFNSTLGYSLDDINKNCRYFINGHLHNHFTDNKIINLGNITGQNFSEDASIYPHVMAILDTKTMKIEYIKNPYALCFYKLDYSLDNVPLVENPEYSVVTVKCTKDKMKSLTEYYKNCLCSRFLVDNTVKSEYSDNDIDTTVDLSIDHLNKFKEFVVSQIGSDEKTMSELQKVLE